MQFVTCMQQVVSSVNPLANQDLSACRAMGEELYEPLKMIYGLATKSSVRTAAWKGMKSELLKYGNILTCTGPYTDPALCNYMQGRLLGDFVADYALTAGSLKLVEGVKKVAKVTNFTTALKVIGTVENGFTSINNTVGKLQNAIIQKVGTGANLTAKLIVNGSTELLSYSRKVINVPASRWITSTSGWTYVSSITGDYIDQTGKKVKGYLKIYKQNCLTGNSIATNANARVESKC